MRTSLLLQVAAALVLQACTLEVSDPPDEVQALSTTLDGELGLEGLDPDECPQKPGAPIEIELMGLENPAAEGDIPPVVLPLENGTTVSVGEGTVHPNNTAAKIDEHYLEAYPHFDDCTMPGHACWD